MSFVALPDTTRTDAALNSLSDRAGFFFVLLLTQVDAWGRIDANAKVLNGTVWPMRDRSAAETQKCLDECAKAGVLTLHEQDGLRWVQIQGWEARYRQVGAAKSKRPKSLYPDFQGRPIGMGSVCIGMPSGCNGMHSDGIPMHTPGAVRCGAVSASLSGEGEPEREGASELPAVPDKAPVAVAAGDVLDEPEFGRLAADPGFAEFWRETWLPHRRETGHAYKPRGAREALRQAAKFGASVWIAAARQSMASGWQGVFPEKLAQQQAARVPRGELAAMRAIEFGRRAREAQQQAVERQVTIEAIA